MTAQRLRSETDRLLDRVTVWTPGRWAAAVVPGDAGAANGGELVHRLVQRLADLAADAERLPRRTVPRLEHDLGLPDQLRVLSHDLLTTGAADAVLAAAAGEVAATRRRLTR